MTSFTQHPIRKRSALTARGGGVQDDALELAVTRIQTCAGEQTVVYSAGFGQRNEENRYVSNFLTEVRVC
jgi:hypothetical protein